MTFAPAVVNILGIKINAMDHGAVLSMGPSQHLDLFVSYKRNQGIGEQNGDMSPTVFSTSSVSDMDLVDSPTVKSSIL
jgi:hypothetical protein